MTAVMTEEQRAEACEAAARKLDFARVVIESARVLMVSTRDGLKRRGRQVGAASDELQEVATALRRIAARKRG